jgi:predicted transcriptional regulator
MALRLYQLLGSTEHEIMDFLWAHGPATVAQIIEAIRLTRPTAYTTVKTTIETLLDKGFVTRARTRGWAHTYSAAPKAVLLAAVFEHQLAELGATPADRAHSGGAAWVISIASTRSRRRTWRGLPLRVRLVDENLR